MCKVVSVDGIKGSIPNAPKVIFASFSNSVRTPFKPLHVGKIVCIPVVDFENVTVRNYYRRTLPQVLMEDIGFMIISHGFHFL